VRAWASLREAGLTPGAVETQHGLQVPYVVGSSLLVAGGWLCFFGATPDHRGLAFVFVGILLSSAGATFLCTLPVPLSSRWFPLEERTFATSVGAMALVCGIACSYVLQAAFHKDIPRFLLLNAVLSTTTLPLAPLFRDPPGRVRGAPAAPAEAASLLSAGGSLTESAPSTRPPAVQGKGVPPRRRPSLVPLGENLEESVRLNTILWLTDWRVALLLLGSTYVLGFGFTFLSLIDEVLPPDLADIKTALAVVFLFSGMTGMVAIGSFVDATKEFIGTLRAVLLVLVASYAVMAVAWQFGLQALLYASASLVAASTFAVMPVSLEICVELTYHAGEELEGAINSWIAVIGSSVWNSVTIYVADPNLLHVPLRYTGWLWLAFIVLGAAVLVPVEGRLHRTEEEASRRQKSAAAEASKVREASLEEGGKSPAPAYGSAD